MSTYCVWGYLTSIVVRYRAVQRFQHFYDQRSRSEQFRCESFARDKGARVGWEDKVEAVRQFISQFSATLRRSNFPDSSLSRSKTNW